MDFDWSSTPIPQPAPAVSLRVVFRVNADPSYDVPKHLPEAMDWVALRTFSGQGSLTLRGRPPMTVLPDTLMLFPHRDVRHYGCASEQWDFYWFEFDAAGWLQMPAGTSMHVEPFDGEPEQCSLCMESLRGGNDGGHRLASALFSVLLSRWMLRQDVFPRKNAGGQAVRQALQHMESHLGEPFSMRELAEKAGFCDRRLRQLFLEETGMSPKKHQERIRMEKAKAMLIHTSFPIGRMAEILGYSSPFHFSRHFQAVHGMSPSQYRLSARER